jgi:hypothetical protein
MAHNLRSASWRRPTPAAFEAISWERTHTSGGFPYGYSHKAVAVPKAVDWLLVPSQQQIALYLVQHGSVFTASPALANPYTIRLFKVLSIYSHTGG